MSVNNSATTENSSAVGCMQDSLDSLKITTVLHAPNLVRIVIEIKNVETWYAIMREARIWFTHNNWKSQPRVRRKLESAFIDEPYNVWFDVPDVAFASWISVKLAVRIVKITNK